MRVECVEERHPAPPAPAGSARLTVIVPTLRDDGSLAELLPALSRLDSPPQRVIVADGAASEQTAALCDRHGARWLPSPSGRGRQLGAAVSAARSGSIPGAAAEVLWFLHADSRPHPRAGSAIGAAVRRGAAGGYFRFRFGGPASMVKSFLERSIALRCRFGMVYGDQGIFATREAYEAGPGFAAQPLFEEVPLVHYLKQTRRFVALDLPITVDPRRWERDGYLRCTLHNRLLALGHLVGVPPVRLSHWYRAR